MQKIMIAVKPGTVYMDGARRMVRKGRSTAHSTHPIVERYPHLWEPIQVDYPDDDSADAAYTEAVTAAGVPFVEALRLLAQGLADRGHDIEVAAGDEPSVPVAVVEYALGVIDRAASSAEEASDQEEESLEVTTLADAEPVPLLVESEAKPTRRRRAKADDGDDA